jgi:hypothetical protein
VGELNEQFNSPLEPIELIDLPMPEKTQASTPAELAVGMNLVCCRG